MKIVRIGLDLAKNVFSVCGVDVHGKVAVRKTLRLDQVLVWFAQAPAFCNGYSDADIVALVYYVTGQFGGRAATITPDQVAGRHEKE